MTFSELFFDFRVEGINEKAREGFCLFFLIFLGA